MVTFLATLFVVLIIALAGSYAWVSISQTITNEMVFDPPDDPPQQPDQRTLTVRKIIDGEHSDPNRRFPITVRIDDEIYHIELRDGEREVFDVLPGSTYSVTENPVPRGYTVRYANRSGTIPLNHNIVATVVNTYNEIPEMGSLAISKRVEGSGGDRNKRFNFNVTIGAIRYRITLAHGEQYVITDIPVGTWYRVTEQNYSSEGYTTTSTGTSGNIVNGRQTAAFINTRGALTNEEMEDDSGWPNPRMGWVNPITGGDTPVWIWLIVIALALIGLRIAIFYGKKRK